MADPSRGYDRDDDTVWRGDDVWGPDVRPGRVYTPDDEGRYGGGYAEAWRDEARRDGPPHRHRHHHSHDEHRNFWDRSRDEVAAWFGDREAEERRREDGQHRGRGPRNYRRSDHRIHEDVNDRLTDDPWLDASGIEVRVEGGEVALEGFVHTDDDVRRAHDIAAQVSGVHRVRNALQVERAPRPWPEGAWERPY